MFSLTLIPSLAKAHELVTKGARVKYLDGENVSIGTITGYETSAYSTRIESTNVLITETIVTRSIPLLEVARMIKDGELTERIDKEL